MDLKEIIRRVGYFRNKANYSARALSLTIGKNSAYITKMETGEFEPSMKIILDIIEACNITPEEFFYENVNSYKIDKENLNILKTLPESKKIALKELLK